MKAKFARLAGLVLAVAFSAEAANAQGVIVPKRAGKVQVTQGSATTTAAPVLGAGNPVSSIISWQVCHNVGSSATYLAVGDGADPAASGRLLAPGACMACTNCGPATLKNLKVKGQAAAGYSVEQYGE